MLWSSGGVHVESDGAREDEENERRQLANDQNTSCEGWSVVFMEREFDGSVESRAINGESSRRVWRSETAVDTDGAKR